MAGAEKKPPDRPGKKFYKCHQDTRYQSVVCIICEDVYHINDFTRSNCGIIISETLALCKEHKELDLTSKSDEHVLTSEIKKIIASIRNNARIEINNREQYYEMKIQEMSKIIEQKNNDLQIRDNYIQEQKNKMQCLQETKHMHSDTDMELDNIANDETIFEKADYENLKMENAYLKKLNEELEDKNQILKEFLKKEKESVNNNLNKSTFAEVAKKSYVQKPKKRIPRIRIKKTKKQGTLQEIKEQVTRCLIQDKSIQTNKIFENKNKEEIFVSCCDNDSVEKAVKSIHNKLSTKCNVIIEELNKPKMKVIGIQNLEEMNETELEIDINERNFTEFNEGCTILHKYTNKKKGTQSVLIEVTGEIYKYIRENNNKIYVGHQKCLVYDVIDVKPCYNCGRYGHKGHKCRNQATCIKCAGDHKGSECTEEEYTCANCEYSNNRFNTKYKTDHEATNYARCEIFKAKVKKYIDSTDYRVDPALPKDVGKVDNLLNSPMSARHSGQTPEALNALNNRVRKRL